MGSKKKSALTFLIMVICLVNSLFAQQTTSLFQQDIQDPTKLIAFSDSLIDSEMNKEFLPGVMLTIVHNNDVLLNRTYGYAHLENKVPISANRTISRIGSISKVFTTLALLQLIEKGELNESDNVASYLPESLSFNNPYDQPLLVKHLLNHTSGFDQILTGRLYDDPDERPDLSTFLDGSLLFVRPPGVAATYDTYGITLAGLLIEQVSGMSYSDYLEKNIFEPLDMSRSFVEVPEAYQNDLMTGYGYENGSYIPQKYEWYVTTPASSIDATLTDMQKFLLALVSIDSATEGRFLNQNSLTKLHSDPDDTYLIPSFHYGFWEEYYGNVRAIYHGGVMKGYSSRLYMIPEFNVGFYIHYNRDLETGPNPRLKEIFTQALLKRWFGEPDYSGFEATQTNYSAADGIAGIYADGIYCRTCYEGEGAGRNIFSMQKKDSLTYQFFGLDFQPIQKNLLATEDGKYRLLLHRDENETVRFLQASTSPSYYEKVNEALIAEVLGKDALDSSFVSPFKAMSFRAMGAIEPALHQYDQLTELRPNDGVLWYYIGDLSRQQGNLQKSTDAFVKTYELNHWRPWAAYAAAQNYMKLKEQDSAFQWLKKAVETGFNKENIMRDPAFKPLMDNTAFKEWISN